MSYLFPQRKFKKLQNFIDVNDINTAPPNDADSKQEKFEESTKRYGGFGWILSFFPGFNKARKAYAKTVFEFTQNILGEENAVLDLEEDHPFQYMLLESLVLPSWPKTLLVIGLGLVMLAIALTGVGALAQLGVLGSVFAIGAIGKLSLGAFTYLAAQFSLSTLTFTAITTAVSTFFAAFAWRELNSPMSFLYNTLFAEQIRSNNSVYAWLENLPLISDIFEITYRDHKDSYKFKLKQNWIEEGLKFLFNPVRWLNKSLTFIEVSLYAAIELGTDPGEDSAAWRAFLKGFIHGTFDLIHIPLDFLQNIFDMPFIVLKGAFYDFPCWIISSCKEGKKRENNFSDNESDSCKSYEGYSSEGMGLGKPNSAPNITGFDNRYNYEDGSFYIYYSPPKKDNGNNKRTVSITEVDDETNMPALSYGSSSESD